MSMYHNEMKSILRNKTILLPQISMINGVAVTNQSNQSGKGYFAQQQRHRLTPNIVAGNSNVQDIIFYHRINPIS